MTISRAALVAAAAAVLDEHVGCPESCEWLEVETCEIPGVWVSTCGATDIISQGTSEAEAREAVRSAVGLCTEWDTKAGLVPRRCLMEAAA